MIRSLTGTALPLLLSLCLLATPAMSKELVGSIAQMPVVSESADKGVLIDLIKALEKEAGVTIKREVVPFARSMDNVINHRADFHFPLIVNPETNPAKLDFDFSAETVYTVNFVIYSNKNKPLDTARLATYKLETDRAHTQYFPFPVDPSVSLDSSLKKIEAGRIDGLIFADVAVDPLIKEMGLKNIHRSLYKVFDVKFVLPKGGHGGETDQMLSAAVRAVKKNGTHDRIMGPVYKPYSDWQP